MRLKITHTTSYSYDQPLHYALLQLRLTPRDGHGQRVYSWSSHVTGATPQVSFTDHFRNHVDLVLMDEAAQKIEITCTGEVETEDRNGVLGQDKGHAPLWLFLQKTAVTTPGAAVRKLVKGLEGDVATDTLAAMHRLSELVGEAVAYEKGVTTAATTAEEAMAGGKGVCQDHAHVMIAAARQLGVPARYVSGYLMLQGMDQQEAAHGWAEVHVGALGWVGFDVSNAICPDERYVRVAVGRDYGEAAPVHGLRHGSAKEELYVSLQVQQ